MTKKKNEQRNSWKKLLIAIAIGIAVVNFWRGVWDLTDYYLLPNHWVISNWISVVASLIILIASHKAIKALI